MSILTKNRESRFPSLPTAMLWLALGASFASVGHAEEALQNVTVTGRAPMETPATAIRNELQATAEDAVWLTRISVASKLSARLHHQRRPFRVASRGWFWHQG